MKSKRLIAAVLGFALVAVGAGVAFATVDDAQTSEPVVAVSETAVAGTRSTQPQDISGKESITFVGIDAVAAEVLGVSEESLAGLNHAKQLYDELAAAGKVNEFKTALIAAKQAQYDAMAELGKFPAGKFEEKLARYTQIINDWDGTTELAMSFSKNKLK